MNDITIADIYELCAKDDKEFSLIFQRPSDILIFEWRWIVDSKVHEYRHVVLINHLNQLIDAKGAISDFSSENNWINYGVRNGY